MKKDTKIATLPTPKKAVQTKAQVINFAKFSKASPRVKASQGQPSNGPFDTPPAAA